MIGWYLSRAVGYVIGLQLELIVGFAYPAYASFKAIETDDKKDDTQWLTYWTVFSFFNIFEFFADEIIAWIPFYYEVKIVFMIWLQAPQTNGANYFYEQILSPFLTKHQKNIDERLAEAKTVATEKFGQAAELIKDKIGDEVSETIQKTVRVALKGGEEEKKSQ